jgi:hypothetical protein
MQHWIRRLENGVVWSDGQSCSMTSPDPYNLSCPKEVAIVSSDNDLQSPLGVTQMVSANLGAEGPYRLRLDLFK